MEFARKGTKSNTWVHVYYSYGGFFVLFCFDFFFYAVYVNLHLLCVTAVWGKSLLSVSIWYLHFPPLASHQLYLLQSPETVVMCWEFRTTSLVWAKVRTEHQFYGVVDVWCCWYLQAVSIWTAWNISHVRVSCLYSCTLPISFPVTLNKDPNIPQPLGSSFWPTSNQERPYEHRG